MKKINFSLVIVSASILFSACSKPNKNSYLSGEIKDGKGKMIYLEQLQVQSAVIVDSALIDDNGHFEFVNFKPTLNFYRLKIKPNEMYNFCILILDSTDKVTLSADASNLADAKITGSAETDAFLDFNNISKKYKKQIDSLQNYFQTEIMNNPNDSKKIEQLKTEIDKVYQDLVSKWQNELAQKAMQYKDKLASAYIALQMLPPRNYLDVYQEIDKTLGSKHPHHPMVQILRRIVAEQTALAEGTPCPEIALPDPNGKEIRLSSFKGKVVLIDFWASWCKPCRIEMPNMVALYKKYKEKGFEILGVSLDKDKDKWVQAIKEDGITWPQVSDLKFWNSEAVKLFNVKAIPYTVLVDKEGKIFAKGLRGAELEDAVKKALGI